MAAVYADQNEKDYEAFAAAVKSGRLVARTGIYAPGENLSTRKTCPVACVTFAIPWEP